MSELLKITDKLCNTCKYCKGLKNKSIKYCDYICMTGHSRNCDYDYCDKWEAKDGKKM